MPILKQCKLYIKQICPSPGQIQSIFKYFSFFLCCSSSKESYIGAKCAIFNFTKHASLTTVTTRTEGSQSDR